MGCGGGDKSAVAEKAPEGAKTMDQAAGDTKGVQALTLSKSAR
jgi:hypothetical protein